MLRAVASSRLEVLLEIAADRFAPVRADPVEAVTLLRQEDKVKVFVRLYQRIDHLYRLREEHFLLFCGRPMWNSQGMTLASAGAAEATPTW